MSSMDRYWYHNMQQLIRYVFHVNGNNNYYRLRKVQPNLMATANQCFACILLVGSSELSSLS